MKNLTRSGAPIGACPEEDQCVPLLCDLCRTEIPPGAELTFEGADYAVHFCGLGCLETWKLKHFTEIPGSRAAKEK